MSKLTSDEVSFIFSIYNLRHNTNEILLILPWVMGFLFSLLGVPFIAVDMDNLRIPEEILGNFEKETAKSVRLSDIDEEGRIVNTRYYVGVTGTKK